MLPLITNTLPQGSVSQPATQAASQAAFLSSQGDAAAAARQQTAVAVTATGALAAYSPNTPQLRQAVPVVRNPAMAQPERAGILPDPEFWKVPTREASDMLPVPTPTPLPTAIKVNVSQETQFSAQAFAQQASAAPAPKQQQEIAESSAPPMRRSTGLPSRKPGIANTQGLDAYAITAQRNATPAPTIEVTL